MKSIPTKTQETKTNTEKIDKTQNVLTKLQDSPAFKNLPNNIQRQVNRILNLTKRDDKVDAKIAESQKEVTNIENQIAKFNADNVNKAQESLSITNTITIMKSQNIQSQQLEQLEQQQAELTTAMENNITKIASLKSELVAPQARLERLQNRDERIE
jgi:chromosome segregation ATPase